MYTAQSSFAQRTMRDQLSTYDSGGADFKKTQDKFLTQLGRENKQAQHRIPFSQSGTNRQAVEGHTSGYTGYIPGGRDNYGGRDLKQLNATAQHESLYLRKQSKKVLGR